MSIEKGSRGVGGSRKASWGGRGGHPARTHKGKGAGRLQEEERKKSHKTKGEKGGKRTDRGTSNLIYRSVHKKGGGGSHSKKVAGSGGTSGLSKISTPKGTATTDKTVEDPEG